MVQATASLVHLKYAGWQSFAKTISNNYEMMNTGLYGVSITYMENSLVTISRYSTAQ